MGNSILVQFPILESMYMQRTSKSKNCWFPLIFKPLKNTSFCERTRGSKGGNLILSQKIWELGDILEPPLFLVWNFFGVPTPTKVFLKCSSLNRHRSKVFGLGLPNWEHLLVQVTKKQLGCITSKNCRRTMEGERKTHTQNRFHWWPFFQKLANWKTECRAHYYPQNNSKASTKSISNWSQSIKSNLV